jgi:hypothetical protein
MAKKETKPKAKKKTQQTEKTELPTELSQEDRLVLQIVVRDFENANLQAQLHQVRAQQFQAQAEKAQQKVREINAQINEKYGLSSERGDRVEVTTGTITRGE